jgi:hypothetical protein
MAHPASDASTVVVNPTATETSTNPVWRFVTNPWFLVFVALAIGVTLGILFTPSLLPYVFLLAETPFFAALGGMSSLYAAGAVIAVTAGATMAVAGGVLKAFVEAADWALGRIFGGQANQTLASDSATRSQMDDEHRPMLPAAGIAPSEMVHSAEDSASHAPASAGPAGNSGNPFVMMEATALPAAPTASSSHSVIAAGLHSGASVAAAPGPHASPMPRTTHKKVPSFMDSVAALLRIGRATTNRKAPPVTPQREPEAQASTPAPGSA